MQRILIFIFILSFSGPVIAQGQPFKYCSVAGYFEGEGKDFYNDIATGVISKNNLSSDPVCKAEYKRGVAAAIYYKTNGRRKNEEDKFTAEQAFLFKAKIRRFITEGIGL